MQGKLDRRVSIISTKSRIVTQEIKFLVHTNVLRTNSEVYIIVNMRIAKEERTCYQAPKRQLKHDGTGPLELCSPLYHLMRNDTIKIRSVIVKYSMK